MKRRVAATCCNHHVVLPLGTPKMGWFIVQEKNTVFVPNIDYTRTPTGALKF
jgi:hypothetical protein